MPCILLATSCATSEESRNRLHADKLVSKNKASSEAEVITAEAVQAIARFPQKDNTADMSTNSYNPGSVAASYISSAFERIDALKVLYALPEDALENLRDDLNKALQILEEEDLPEMEYDEFMKLIGEDTESSFDPFDSYEENSNDIMLWADEYADDSDDNDDVEQMRMDMMRLQDELRVLKDNQKNAGHSQGETQQAREYELALAALIAQQQAAIQTRQQDPSLGQIDPIFAQQLQQQQQRLQQKQQQMQQPQHPQTTEFISEDLFPQPFQAQQVDQQQELARQAAQQMQEAVIPQQPQQSQPVAQQPAQMQQQNAQLTLEAERARAEHQKFMTEQHKKRAAAKGANAAVMPSSSPQKPTRKAPDVVEMDMNPASMALDVNIDHVPFYAAEFDVRDASVQSSMYVECWNKNIGEWDIGTLLSEEALDVCEFQITGTFPDKTNVLVSWNAESKVIMAQVSANHRVGMLTESTAGTQRQGMVKTARPDIQSILEEAPAYSAAEALSYLTEFDISTISLDIVYDESNYTLYFSDHSADVEVSWVQDKMTSSHDLAYLVGHISSVLADYAVMKDGDKVAWNQERQNQTRAGWYHINKTKYSADVNKGRTGTKTVLNVSAITVTEEGVLTVKQFTGN